MFEIFFEINQPIYHRFWFSSETYLEPFQASRIERFEKKMVNGLKPLTIFRKRPILDFLT